MDNITVRSRLGELEAQSDGQVVSFTFYDSQAERDVRHYILLDKSIKLMHEPWGWKDRWYADLVLVRWVNDAVLELRDLYLDIIIEGEGPTYRMIDFDDFAKALAAGEVNGEDLVEPLGNLQRFLDEHLHGAREFPPKCIVPFMPAHRE